MDNMHDALPLLPPIGLNVDVNTAIALAVANNAVAKSSGRKSGAPHRRTCSVAGCKNGVVQGGLCVSHGAKRKTCRFPGCEKNSKLQGCVVSMDQLVRSASTKDVPT
eukprot:g3080.t1 g3080   contig12:1376898-1377577(+)